MADYGVTVPETALLSVVALARLRVMSEARLAGYGPGVKALREIERRLIGEGVDPGRLRDFNPARFPYLADLFPWWVEEPTADLERNAAVRRYVRTGGKS